MAGTRGRMATVGAATALLLGAGAGCATEYEGADLETADTIEFAATPEYVGEVVDASTSQAYRFSMSMSFAMGGESFDAEIATGAADGEKQQITMDFGAMFDQIGGAAGEELPPGLSADEFVMEQVIDGEAMYIRAPFFTAMADEVGESAVGEDFDLGGGSSEAGEDLMAAFEQIGDGWGRVDLDALGDVLPSDVQQSLGGQSASPDVFLDMLRSTGEVEDLGTDEIDGVAVHGLSARVGLDDLLASQGTDPGALGSELGDETVTGMFGAFEFPLSVWIDDDDRIRRIDFSFGADSFAEAAEEMGEEVPADDLAEMSGFEMGMTMDFSDYGDDIAIVPPDGAVDITEPFVAAFDEIYGG